MEINWALGWPSPDAMPIILHSNPTECLLPFFLPNSFCQFLLCQVSPSSMYAATPAPSRMNGATPPPLSPRDGLPPGWHHPHPTLPVGTKGMLVIDCAAISHIDAVGVDALVEAFKDSQRLHVMLRFAAFSGGQNGGNGELANWH